jgi:hypothetical protein
VPGGIVDFVAADRIDAGLAGDLLDLPVLAVGRVVVVVLGVVVGLGPGFIRVRGGRFGFGFPRCVLGGRVLGGRVSGGASSGGSSSAFSALNFASSASRAFRSEIGMR